MQHGLRVFPFKTWSRWYQVTCYSFTFPQDTNTSSSVCGDDIQMFQHWKALIQPADIPVKHLYESSRLLICAKTQCTLGNTLWEPTSVKTRSCNKKQEASFLCVLIKYLFMFQLPPTQMKIYLSLNFFRFDLSTVLTCHPRMATYCLQTCWKHFVSLSGTVDSYFHVGRRCIQKL